MRDTDQDRAAADWLARRDAGEWTSDDQAAFAEWLEESSANRIAFLRLDHVWSNANRLAALGGGPLRRWRRPFRGWQPTKSLVRKAAAPIVAIAMAGAAAMALFTMPTTASTGIGERRTITLADGSSLELAPLTKVRYRIDSTRRSIWIDEGEAYFDVRHDAANPFIVFAGNRRIVDVGTRFSVRTSNSDISVVVEEGEVEVSSIADKDAEVVTLRQGSMANARGAAQVIVSSNPVAVAHRLSWRDGMLAFDEARLDEVASEFNRYNRQQLVIASPKTAAMRIGGRFRATNVDGFANLLRDAYGLKVTKTDQQITVSE
ncbi:transmembrane sensor [Erythromicrobium ramosum]|uniref:DUF4880 domain-containing protein n=1 Tax=Erythrobacter ramosus TaxID=35811 RepID=A0A6I4UI08_9SPHN|nr:FecR domain-containing protein [Erythrobacter ramosus]MBB3775241.1 transmembrane sensor [Erythrobacter ramosus]MXP37135.1 DUF4880 domain-containing protein [Erythrobacter ramosus]